MISGTLAVGLVFNLQPELNSFREIPKVWKNWSWGTVLQATPKENFLHRVRVLVHGYLRITFDLPRSILLTLEIYTVFPNWGPITLMGYPRG